MKVLVAAMPQLVIVPDRFVAEEPLVAGVTIPSDTSPGPSQLRNRNNMPNARTRRKKRLANEQAPQGGSGSRAGSHPQPQRGPQPSSGRSVPPRLTPEPQPRAVGDITASQPLPSPEPGAQGTRPELNSLPRRLSSHNIPKQLSTRATPTNASGSESVRSLRRCLTMQ